MKSNRRVFIMQVVAAGAAVTCQQLAQAQAKTRVQENDPKAASLGYRHDATQVDTKRFPKKGANERCSNCMAFLGKPTDAWGECDLLTDKLVSGTGWCSSYVKAT